MIFGITGGIGSGKSTVCSFLKEKGVVILEADPLAKRLTESSPQVRQALVSNFGAEVYLPDGSVNKQRMRELVFGEPGARQKINNIIHPPVLEWIQNEAARLRSEENRNLVGVEAALIFESGMEAILDAVVLVAAPDARRVEWVRQRDALSVGQVNARMGAQIDVDEAVGRADYVVDNTGSLSELRTATDALYDWLLQRGRSSNPEE